MNLVHHKSKHTEADSLLEDVFYISLNNVDEADEIGDLPTFNYSVSHIVSIRIQENDRTRGSKRNVGPYNMEQIPFPRRHSVPLGHFCVHFRLYFKSSLTTKSFF